MYCYPEVEIEIEIDLRDRQRFDFAGPACGGSLQLAADLQGVLKIDLAVPHEPPCPTPAHHRALIPIRACRPTSAVADPSDPRVARS